MMLPLVVVGHTSKQSVSQCEATAASGVDNAASPDWQTIATDYFTLREADHYAKTTGRNPEVHINEQCRGMSCPYRWATHAIIVSNTHALPAEYKCLK